MNRISNLVG